MTNSVEFHPIDYNTTEELDDLIAPDAINVTEQFGTVLMYGFISNCIYLFYLIFMICFAVKVDKYCHHVMLFVSVGMNLMWVV